MLTILRRISGVVAMPAVEVRPHVPTLAPPVIEEAIAKPDPLLSPPTEIVRESGWAPGWEQLVPPTWTPGLCHHDLHIERDGRRIGITLLDDGRASWLPCLHIGKDGNSRLSLPSGEHLP